MARHEQFLLGHIDSRRTAMGANPKNIISI